MRHVAAAVGQACYGDGREEISGGGELAAHLAEHCRGVERAFAAVGGYRKYLSSPKRLAAAKHLASNALARTHESFGSKLRYRLARNAHADAKCRGHVREFRQHLALAVVARNDCLTQPVR